MTSRARALVSDRERITVLEGRSDAHDVALMALGPMQTQLKDIHDMLIAGRAILWLLGKVSAWVGGPSVIAGVGYAAWRTFIGH